MVQENNFCKGGKIKTGKELFKRLSRLLEAKQSFVIESTLSGLYIKKIIETAKRRDYNVKLLYIFLDTPELAVDRVKIRVKAGGHNVPEKDIIRRFYRSKKNFWHIYKNLCDKWQLFYNW